MAKITGTKRNDKLNGTKSNDEILGLGGNDILSGFAGIDKMVGGLGNDIYIVDNSAEKLVEKGNQGTDTVKTSVSFTLAANFENLTLTGNKAINGTGNTAVNVLTGNSANNILDGKAGADKMAGAKGNDTYVVDNAGDKVIEKANAGIDTVNASVSHTLATNVENLTLTGNKVINATGNTLANTLTGNGANNVLDGKAGADTMAGGAGDDTYVVDDTGDTVTELSGGGTDTVNAAVSYTLGANVENLTLTGELGINGTGNDSNNVLTGNGASNVLDGGAGTDTLIGGAGDDFYTIDDAGDVVTEALNEGDGDIVNSTIDYTLVANVETLNLLGVLAIDGTGNELDNTINGNGAANIVNGGFGADTMAAADGDDTYVVDNVGDTVFESQNQGIDLVQSSITWTLASNVENLTLTGSNAIDGEGNDLDNTLTGNGASNSLSGGLGNNTLIGAGGDDNYTVNVSTNVIVEEAGQGTDSVLALVNWTLGANIENLRLFFSSLTGTGNELDNVLRADGSNSTLNGEGGSDRFSSNGEDNTLIGGAGDDFYEVQFSSNVLIEDSGQGTDTVNAFVNWTLGANFENLTLQGSGLVGTGNELDNILEADGVNNTLIGGTGNDTFVLVDDTTDIVIDSSGIDRITSTISRNLGDYASIENLTLLGSGNINASGNSSANVIVGNGADNTLIGYGGDDTLTGGSGTDVFEFDLSFGSPSVGNDTITDFIAGNGSDELLAFRGEFTSLAELQSAGTTIANDGAGNCIITLPTSGGSNTIKLIGVLASQLDESDFYFNPL